MECIEIILVVYYALNNLGWVCGKNLPYSRN